MGYPASGMICDGGPDRDAAGSSFPDAALVALVTRAHGRLARRLAEARPDPREVLDLGTAVILHGALERRILLAQAPVLDQAAVAQLDEEHARLEEDLELLESILASNPDSPDVESLCDALLGRLRGHVARDDRVLYRLALGVRADAG